MTRTLAAEFPTEPTDLLPFLPKHESFLPSLSLPADVSPHITGCVSANMETFRCRWNVGPFQSGQLRLFYINKKSGACVGLLWI